MFSFVVRVTGQQTQFGFSVNRLVEVEHSMLHRYERGKLGQNDGGYGEEIPLALEKTREFGHVRFQPVLRGTLFGRLPKVANHFVDVVLQGSNFTGRFNSD